MKPNKPATPAESESDRSGNSVFSFADRLRDSRAAQPEKHQTLESWVAFRISNRRLALPVSHVREILRLEEITGVPNAPAPVAGVMNLRGHVLPVVDTHSLLALPGALATDHSRVLVCVLESRPIGLVVDDVAGLERLHMELVQPVPADEPLARRSQGVYPTADDEFLLLLEPTQLFADTTAPLNQVETSHV